MVLLIKDHKKWSVDSGKPPPVVSGNTGLNCHLSELLSHILELITSKYNGAEFDCTCQILKQIEDLSMIYKSKSYFEAKMTEHVVPSDALCWLKLIAHVKY